VDLFGRLAAQRADNSRYFSCCCAHAIPSVGSQLYEAERPSSAMAGHR
jgi:hypothetical protein